jgi:DNA-directed RNA polymerase beta subunit
VATIEIPHTHSTDDKITCNDGRLSHTTRNAIISSSYQRLNVIMDESESYDDYMDELTKPVGKVEEKWKLLPHFLRMRGLMRQHIDSFDHFVNIEIKKIVAAQSNREVRSEADPKFFLSYTDIYVGQPTVEEESFVTSNGKTYLNFSAI